MVIKNHLNTKVTENIHAFNIKSLAGIMGTKGFDFDKTSIMELIVTKALNLRKVDKDAINILDLGDDIPNVRFGSYISHAEIKTKLEIILNENIVLIEDEIS